MIGLAAVLAGVVWMVLSFRLLDTRPGVPPPRPEDLLP